MENGKLIMKNGKLRIFVHSLFFDYYNVSTLYFALYFW